MVDQNKIINGIRNCKLLLSIIVDNSSSMKGEKIQKLKAAISDFNYYMLTTNLSNYFEYTLIVFDGLHSKKLKDFNNNNFNVEEMVEGGLALLENSLQLGFDELYKRLSELNYDGVQCFKPWLILLSDGQSYENIDLAVTKLKDLYQNGKLTYFPFLLSSNKIDERLDELKNVKKPISILNNQYDQLFMWMYETVKKRVVTPIERSMKLESDCFDGWTMK